MRLRSSLLVFALMCGAQDIGPLLDAAKGRAPRSAGAVGANHVNDVNAVLNYWARPGVWNGGNRVYLDQSFAYLSSLEAYAAQNQALAVALASAYRQLALVQEPYARDSAYAAYAVSARLYNRWAAVNPAYRNELIWLSNRYYGLSGIAPVWAPSYWVRPVEGLDALRATATPVYVPPPPGMVAWPEGADGPDELRQKFSEVSAAVHTAHLAAQPIRESVAGMGQAVSVKEIARMQSLLELAQEQIRQKNFTGARENLDIAGVLAKRVAKTFGAN